MYTGIPLGSLSVGNGKIANLDIGRKLERERARAPYLAKSHAICAFFKRIPALVFVSVLVVVYVRFITLKGSGILDICGLSILSILSILFPD